jgi:hypothetical protein
MAVIQFTEIMSDDDNKNKEVKRLKVKVTDYDFMIKLLIEHDYRRILKILAENRNLWTESTERTTRYHDCYTLAVFTPEEDYRLMNCTKIDYFECLTEKYQKEFIIEDIPFGVTFTNQKKSFDIVDSGNKIEMTKSNNLKSEVGLILYMCKIKQWDLDTLKINGSDEFKTEMRHQIEKTKGYEAHLAHAQKTLSEHTNKKQDYI